VPSSHALSRNLIRRLLRHRLAGGAVVVALLTALSPPAAGSTAPSPDRATIAPLLVGRDTRLMVIGPHPDDVVLAAGGLLQQVRSAGGAVRVVYLTDGEGYPAGVQAEDHLTTPAPVDYLGYGRRRAREARAGLHALGIRSGSVTFLGFPNGGLSRLMTTSYWSNRDPAYRSPYTGMIRPAKADRLVPTAEFRGENLTQELAAIVTAFRPTVVLVPRKEDQHVDHCAAWFFLGDALTRVARAQPGFHADLLTYVVHFNSWPFDDGTWPFRDRKPRFEVPVALRDRDSSWLSVSLSDREMETKREALAHYESQMDVMAWFLKAFVRTNELFARPRSQPIILPVDHNVCDAFLPKPSLLVK